MTDARAVVIEVRRKGRRPRYHRGAMIGRDLSTSPEQCNIDQVALRDQVTILDALPPLANPVPRRGAKSGGQMCLRCWSGTPEMTAAWNAQLPGEAPTTEAPLPGQEPS